MRKSLVRKCYFRIGWCVCIWDIVIIGPGIKLVSVYIPELGLQIRTSIMFKQQTFCAARRCVQIQQFCRWTKGPLSYVCWHTSSTGLSKWLCANSFRMVRRCSHFDPNVVWPGGVLVLILFLSSRAHCVVQCTSPVQNSYDSICCLTIQYFHASNQFYALNLRWGGSFCAIFASSAKWRFGRP